MNIIELICDFKKNNSMLWVEANNIRLFLADGFVNSDGVIDTIKKCKPEILDFLVSNKIFSKVIFKKEPYLNLIVGKRYYPLHKNAFGLLSCMKREAMPIMCRWNMNLMPIWI